ncbi:hypothetical protein [Kordia sp.]|uniref:hypothetical protein n=1 Tax=Kordia sp. TaxID=1965332 RepID=UPI003D26DC09
MDNKTNISYTSPYHELIRKTTFSSSKRYDKFLNWVSGEFDLYLQDESNGLHVFFPEGTFHIKNGDEKGNTVTAEIHLKSKVLQKGIDMIDEIMSVYNLLAKI